LGVFPTPKIENKKGSPPGWGKKVKKGFLSPRILILSHYFGFLPCARKMILKTNPSIHLHLRHLIIIVDILVLDISKRANIKIDSCHIGSE